MLEDTLLIQQLPNLGLFILMILGTLGFPFPEDAILILAGFLVANETIRPLPAFLTVYSGLLVTDFLLYSFGKRYGKKLVERKRFRKVISPERLFKIEGKVEKWGILAVFFGRHLFGVRAQIFLAAGVIKMPYRKFLTADGTSALLAIALWGGLGFMGGNSIQLVRRDILLVEQIGTAVLATLAGSILFFRYVKKRRSLSGRHSPRQPRCQGRKWKDRLIL
jgi:membrane protein DedA with SNARE-associated domain